LALNLIGNFNGDQHVINLTINVMDVDDWQDFLDLEQIAMPRRSEPRIDAMIFYTDSEFHERFRLRKDVVLHLCNELATRLSESKAGSLTVLEQILITLRFLATGSFQLVCADTARISQTTVSRVVSKVVRAILSLRPRMVCFPDNLEHVKHQFYEIANFPGVIALTDGTHIPIIKPAGVAEAEIYRNRKGFFSLNAQVTCGPDMKIYNVVSRWPGSTHDNRIFENSYLNWRLSANQLRGIILADGGYGNKRLVLF
jgi:hypothetical protein